MPEFRRLQKLWIQSILIQLAITQAIPYFNFPAVCSAGLPPRKWSDVQAEGLAINPSGTSSREHASEWGSDLSLATPRHTVQQSRGADGSPSFGGRGVDGRPQTQDWVSRPSFPNRGPGPSGSTNDAATELQKLIRERPDMFLPIQELPTDEASSVTQPTRGRQQSGSHDALRSLSDPLQFLRSLQPAGWSGHVEPNVVRLSPVRAPAGRELIPSSEPNDWAAQIPPETKRLETLSEYYTFRSKNVRYPTGWKRRKERLEADGTLGEREIEDLGRQDREQQIVRDLTDAAKMNPAISDAGGEKSWFQSLAVPTIRYTLGVTLLRIRILHHLFHPVLFESPEKLRNIQSKAVDVVANFWQNGVIPRLFKPMNRMATSSADVVAPEEEAAKKLANIIYTLDTKHSALSWIVFNHWLKEKVMPDHPYIFEILVDYSTSPSDSQPILGSTSLKPSGSHSGEITDSGIGSSTPSNARYGTHVHQFDVQRAFKIYATDIALMEAGFGVEFGKKPVIIRDRHPTLPNSFTRRNH